MIPLFYQVKFNDIKLVVNYSSFKVVTYWNIDHCNVTTVPFVIFDAFLLAMWVAYIIHLMFCIFDRFIWNLI